MSLTLEDISAAVAETEIELIEQDWPDIVPGRVAHIDADFLAYMTSYERKDEALTLPDILFNTDTMIDTKRKEAGAEFAVLHLTPNTSDKGGRYEVAIQKKYQGQRSSDDKPRYLEAVRKYMADMQTAKVTGCSWDNAEADDGMAQAAWIARGEANPDSCVIVTKDKDLRMCPGYHMNWDSGALHLVDDLFGELSVIERAGKVDPTTGKAKITKKVHGWGTKWFWCQLLQGDTADNIKGCPKAMQNGKHKACGQMGAYDLLKDATSDYECFQIVKEAYKSNEYMHWLTGEPAKWVDVFWSEAQMLWMQRTPGDINDVKKWIKEIIENEQGN